MNQSSREQSLSKTMETISRINNKLTTLYEVLKPIILDNKTPETIKDRPIESSLISELSNVENRLTELLDRIQI